jgi:hypothetical protein
MFNPRIIQVEGIGLVLFEPTTRTHRILITVRPGSGVRVAVPPRASVNEAMAFVKAKKAWIQKHLAKIREYDKHKKAFNDAFTAIDKDAAVKKITRRVEQLAQKYGFRYRKVFVRNQRTRWGSCSYKGDISLNIKLVALPPELFDYVILHELAHTKVHNHSPKFWKELDKYVGDGKGMAAQMIEYGLRLL